MASFLLGSPLVIFFHSLIKVFSGNQREYERLPFCVDAYVGYAKKIPNFKCFHSFVTRRNFLILLMVFLYLSLPPSTSINPLTIPRRGSPSSKTASHLQPRAPLHVQPSSNANPEGLFVIHNSTNKPINVAWLLPNVLKTISHLTFCKLFNKFSSIALPLSCLSPLHKFSLA